MFLMLSWRYESLANVGYALADYVQYLVFHSV